MVKSKKIYPSTNTYQMTRFWSNKIGLIIPVIPITAMILKIFDPIKLPIEIPDSFLYAATISS